MKYQIIKQNKTCSRQIGVYETLKQAKRQLMSMHGNLVGNSHVGNFPIFNACNKVYSIQGFEPNYKIVLGIEKEELAKEGLIA